MLIAWWDGTVVRTRVQVGRLSWRPLEFDAVADQTKEMVALVQKVTTETAEPVKAGITKAFKKVS